jgi:hypothetical protein
VRIKAVSLKDVDLIPQNLEDGILYVAEQYRIAVHSCCCGCGMEVTTPLGVGQFRLTRDKVGPTLYPSIGNHDYPCKSHYWIESGKVIDSYPMSRNIIVRNRLTDRDEKLMRREDSAGCLSLFNFWHFKK